MPRIRLILEDDKGMPLPDTTEQVYVLPGSCDTLNRIEAAVETFKQAALPQLEHTLLAQAQQQFVGEEKKQCWTLNGRQSVQVQTLHGAFSFAEQKFIGADGALTSYLRLSAQAHVSVGLREFCLFACTRMSYDTVADMVGRLTGKRLVCAQTLCNWVEAKATEIDALLADAVQQSAALPLPALATGVDVYDAEAEEVLLLTNGICVKAQKPTHEKAGQARREKPCQRHDLDVMLAQNQDGSFRYLAGTSNPVHSLPEIAGAHLRQEWHGQEAPLPIVAITDGARKIRQDLATLFGETMPVIILDWYHLAKRVYEHLSMVAHNRSERETLQHDLLGWLWQGKTQESLTFLAGVTPRNAKAFDELVGYLQKHQSEIIDYGRRALTGKPIGSGRMEKAVDQVVGMRQKKKGMSWSQVGSHALALLKITELNGLWQQLFPQEQVAA